MNKVTPPTQIASVIQLGHPTLWKKAKRVNVFDESLIRLAQTLFATVRHEDGVGIAAPQIGKSIRLFVMDIHQTKSRKKQDTHPPLVIVNPLIKSFSTEVEEDWEGCLSVTTKAGLVFGRVPRANQIEVTFQDVRGEVRHRTFEGFASRVFQHEYDHLDGILFLQRMLDLSTLVDEHTYHTRVASKD